MNYDVRIHKIVGQLEALSRLSQEREAGCDQVLQQVSAVQGAIASLKRQIIDDSFGKCLESRNAHKETKKLLTSIRRYI
jgi:DNA-binding FrmR family transcriptional regulator